MREGGIATTYLHIYGGREGKGSGEVVRGRKKRGEVRGRKRGGGEGRRER